MTAAAGLDAQTWRGMLGVHVRWVTKLADAIFAGDKEAKRTAWRGLRENANVIVNFFESLKSKASARQWQDVSFLWMMHIRCTKLYAKLAKKLDTRASSYEYKQRVTLGYAMEFGALLDKITASSSGRPMAARVVTAAVKGK